jgi:hypothetical protein
MAAEIIPISTQDYFLQDYNPQETNLIPSFEVNTVLTDNSYIEYFVYDINKTILYSSYNFSQYTVLANGQSAGSNNEISQIIVDPEQSLTNTGFSEGEYVTYFNFLNKKIGSNLEQLFISEISSDRTEIRLDSTVLTEFSIVDQTTNFVIERENSPYFLDFYLNFGDNRLVIANNVLLDDQDPNNPTILVKLYEALPENFDLNSTLWVVTLVEEPIAYQVSFPIVPITVIDTFSLKGPNFNLDLKDQINNSTVSLDYTTLTATALTSSQNQLQSLLEEKGIDINIDYSDFNNYIHFSSAQVRLENFYYKIQLLEEYAENINLLNSTTNSPFYTSSSIAEFESKISNIITYFDDYEYYLYYETGPYAWPKTNSQKPYTLAASDSNEALTWIGNTNPASPYYGGLLLSASLFDNDNKDYLLFTIPEYLRNDPQNKPYETFIQMVGQLYDSVWVYYKDIISKYDNDNRLEYGVSKDIVADAIRDFGIKLYQNNFSNDDLYTAFLGLTPQGGLFPFPNITSSLPTPSGFEYINTLISASNDYMPLDDVNKSLYKRIYHNLPYLLKAKGTLPGLRTLITSYGIPDTVLRINEFGGKDKSNSNDWDDWQNVFNYAYYNTGSNKITTNWSLNPSWSAADNVPATLEFRFKIPNLSTVSGSPSIDLLRTDGESRLQLRYTGSGLATASYSGSIVNPYYQYTYLDFYPDLANFSNSSASIYLPFANEGWWSVMVTRTGDDFKLYAGNNVYEGGENGTQLGFYATSSVNEDSTGWSTATTVDFMPQQNEMYLQEIRYYNTILSEGAFKDYIMNPSSTEGNSLNSSPDQLAFRLSLGGELYTGSRSIHPKVTGSWAATSSFVGYSSASFNLTPIFVPNTEYFFLDQPVVGIKNAISDKIRVENSVIPSGNTLSPFRSLAQNLAASQSYTVNTNLLEVAFAPQDEINDDIISQIGFFNIGEYIGDPRQRSSSATSYPDLDRLRNEYFQKYTSNYNLNDYIRLIKYFDNSLFKMIKDFVPARTSLASGVVIKQTLLERNKYPQPQVSQETVTYTGSIESTQLWDPITQQKYISHSLIETFSGGTGGSFELFNGVSTSPYGPNGTGPENIFGITQSWYETAITPSGSVLILHDVQDEFYDGEFSGSIVTVTTQSLSQPYNVENISVNYKHVYYYGISKTQNDIFEDNFLAPQTSPSPGEILFFNYKEKNFLSNPTLNTYTTTFIKIAKEDCNGNDNSLPLGQITKLYVFNPNQAVVYPSNYSLQFDEYNVIVSNEYSDYYLYETNRAWDILSTIGPLVDPHDNQVFDYTVSSSVTASYSVGNGSPKTIINWNSTLAGTNLSHYNTPYFNTSSGIFTFENTPNVPLILSASINTSGNDASSRFISLIQNRNGVETILFQDTYNAGGIDSTLVTASLYPIQGDQYYIQLTKASIGVNVNVTSATLYLYQSWNNFTLDTWYGPSTSSCASTILEPYITEPNYYNSDYNPLINNVFVDRLSTIYQDIDYSTGIYTPTNFNLLISGSALKAAVQDSNYTSKRVTLPRYGGSKSTSQHLNYWTPGDAGTYGKLPTVESLKTMVAYCDWIGGWPPEKENASAIHVQYLIKSDGTVIIPNTSENSLADIKGTFESGENLFITTKTISSGQPQQSRKVLRGGTRIEPVLYTQYGQAPNATWDTTMSFEDIVPSSTGATDDYTALYSYSSTFNPTLQVWSKVSLDTTIYGTSVSNNEYTIPLNAVTDGVNLIVQAKYDLLIPGSSGFPIYGRIVKERGGNKVYYPDISGIGQYYTGGSPYIDEGINSFNIPSSEIESGDKIYLEIYSEGSLSLITNPKLTISQYPVYTFPVTSSGANSIWGYADKTNYPYVITSSQSTLINIYGDNNVKMSNITGSGFNPVTLPWSIKHGDEFRFEDREDFVYQVGKIFGPADSGSGRLFQTGSIEVHFNAPLPVSASTSVFDLDHFVIRRYVDDASQILMEGFAPIDSQGPYIVRPEFVAPELNKSVDQFILDLTQKGLIS